MTVGYLGAFATGTHGDPAASMCAELVRYFTGVAIITGHDGRGRI